eukprot:5711427-Amphidinium_carterae.1
MDENQEDHGDNLYQESYLAGSEGADVDDDQCSTSSEQWYQEDMADPYSQERLSSEYAHAVQDPKYAA